MTGTEPEGEGAAFPRLTEAQFARLTSFGDPETVEAGEVLYGPGDPTYDLIVMEDATVEIVQPATRDAPEESLVRFGPGAFLGELNLLTGQAVYLIARVVENGRVHRIAPASFRRLMAEDPELSDILLEASRPGVRSSRTTAPRGGSRSSAARWIRSRLRFARTRPGDDSPTSGSTPTRLLDTRC